MLELTQKSDFFPSWAHSAETPAGNSRGAWLACSRSSSSDERRGRASQADWDSADAALGAEQAATKRGEEARVYFSSVLLFLVQQKSKAACLLWAVKVCLQQLFSGEEHFFDTLMPPGTLAGFMDETTGLYGSPLFSFAPLRYHRVNVSERLHATL